MAGQTRLFLARSGLLNQLWCILQLISNWDFFFINDLFFSFFSKLTFSTLKVFNISPTSSSTRHEGSSDIWNKSITLSSLVSYCSDSPDRTSSSSGFVFGSAFTLATSSGATNSLKSLTKLHSLAVIILTVCKPDYILHLFIFLGQILWNSILLLLFNT